MIEGQIQQLVNLGVAIAQKLDVLIQCGMWGNSGTQFSPEVKQALTAKWDRTSRIVDQVAQANGIASPVYGPNAVGGKPAPAPVPTATGDDELEAPAPKEEAPAAPKRGRGRPPKSATPVAQEEDDLDAPAPKEAAPVDSLDDDFGAVADPTRKVSVDDLIVKLQEISEHDKKMKTNNVGPLKGIWLSRGHDRLRDVTDNGLLLEIEAKIDESLAKIKKTDDEF